MGFTYTLRCPLNCKKFLQRPGWVLLRMPTLRCFSPSDGAYRRLIHRGFANRFTNEFFVENHSHAWPVPCKANMKAWNVDSGQLW